ncbi:MAG: hydrogenase maturation protease [Saprospiraceae bacterium]|nr:hydrogenase maturation protease [Saprospiraceae bacterium]
MKETLLTQGTKDKVLLIGIGNDGRSDDGLGWAFAEEVESRYPDIEVVYRYQLQIEDAELITHYNRVFFVDSTLDHIRDGYKLEKLTPDYSVSYTSHAITPEVILGLASHIYDRIPQAYVIAITGIDWELKQELSKQGSQHLSSALKGVLLLLNDVGIGV